MKLRTLFSASCFMTVALLSASTVSASPVSSAESPNTDTSLPAIGEVRSLSSKKSCRPAECALPQGFDPSEIYMPSRPSLLPDGKRFIFEWCDAIWIANTDGGVARLLQSCSGRDGWPIVSNDGTKFVFQSNRAGGWHLFVAEISEQSVARQVTFHSEAERPYAWSKDDKSLLCYVLRDDKGSAFDDGRLAWLSIEGRSAEKRVFDAMGVDPSISPDGKLLLFTQEGEDLYRKGFTGENASRVWLYNIEEKKFELMVKHPTESKTPLWAPDGKGFYYVSGQDGTMNVWYRTYPEGEETQVTFFRGDSVIAPTLSADGHTMIFRQGLWFYSMDPTQPQVAPKKISLRPDNTGILRTNKLRRYYDTLWNNDTTGTLTTTSAGLEFAFTVGGDVYAMDTVLREPQCVYGDSRTHEREAVFSKDGSKLYILSDRGDGVALLQAEKKMPKRFWWENSEFVVKTLVASECDRSMLSVSPDGKMLAWVENSCQIILSDTNGKEIRRFPKHQGVNSYDWSPDSKWLVASIADDYDNYDIWIVSVDDPEIEPYNVARNFSWDGFPIWSPDGQILLWLGERSDTGRTIFYVWLNRSKEDALKVQAYRKAIEHMGLNLEQDRPIVQQVLLGTTAAETPDPNRPDGDAKRATETASSMIKIDFDDLHERVHSIANVGNAWAPVFAPDSRRVWFTSNLGKEGTYEIVLPDNTRPNFMTERSGYIVRWYSPQETKGPERIIFLTHDRKIASKDEVYPFGIYQEVEIRDYQELGFLRAWAILRDYYYDPNFHGADWNAIRAKYQAPARFAPSHSVFQRIMAALNGELNSSHTGFYASDDSVRTWGRELRLQAWDPVTSNLGIIFDPDYTGADGWRVKRIIREGPADSAQIGLKPGDMVLAIDGVPIKNGSDPTLLLNGPRIGKFVLDIQSGAEKRKVFIEAITFEKARSLIQDEEVHDRRTYVHERSGGCFGYVTITQMNDAQYFRFEREIFAEGFDKDGMIIDVRDNTGGFTADRILNILGVQRHSWSVVRNGRPAYLSSYWGRPVFDKPIVVLCNQNTVSNGEIFSHAIKQLGRGVLVGVQTNGGVIATRDAPVLDLGKLRQPRYGWYQLDGTDMELQGAIPDIIVENTPADTVAGRDSQLDAAIQALLREVTASQKNAKPFSPKTFNWSHQ